MTPSAGAGDPQLRPARAGDEAFMTGLVPRFIEHGVAGGHTRDEVIEGTARVLRDALARPQPGELILIAEDEHGEPAGFVYAVTQRDFFTGEAYVHVSEIAVAHSGAGVGARLMDAVEAWASDHGCRIVTLNVVDENTPAQRFYQRRGYGIAHRHYIKRLEST